MHLLWDGRTRGWGSPLSRDFIHAAMRSLSLGATDAVTVHKGSSVASVNGVERPTGTALDIWPADLDAGRRAMPRLRAEWRPCCPGRDRRPGFTYRTKASWGTATANMPQTMMTWRRAGALAATVQEFEGDHRRLGAAGGTKEWRGAPEQLPSRTRLGLRARLDYQLVSSSPTAPAVTRGARPRQREAPTPTS